MMYAEKPPNWFWLSFMQIMFLIFSWSVSLSLCSGSENVLWLSDQFCVLSSDQLNIQQMKQSSSFTKFLRFFLDLCITSHPSIKFYLVSSHLWLFISHGMSGFIFNICFLAHFLTPLTWQLIQVYRRL